MKNTKRKGFTIVELVIVIAVIAILAAVLIPTFASLVKKANQSADIQAVKQMNTQLAIDEVDSSKTITDVYEALNEAGMSAKDYHPLASNTYFFWDKDENRILYVDSDYVVQYPEEYKDTKTYNAQTSNWYSLSGEIKEEKVTPSSGIASVATAGELYYLSEHTPNDLTKIEIQNDINLMGANVSFSVVGTTLTVEGKGDGGITLTGLVANEYKRTLNDADHAGRTYSTGFIAKVGSDEATGNSTLTIQKITIKDSVVGDLETGSIGALVGDIRNSGTSETTPYRTDVTIEDCSVEDTIVNGRNKIGALIGGIGLGSDNSVTIKNCTVKGCTVNCSEGQAARVIGCIWSGTVTIENYTEQNNTVNLVDSNREVIENAEISYGNTDKMTTTIVKVKDKDNEYRIFDKDAIFTIQIGTLKINTGSSYAQSQSSGTYNSGSINILKIIKSDS